ncbi:FMN-dependent alpha-hydroxy acid dehydrogenase [Rhizoclosmatium globosum]|uniref:L-lactate dehydrogenase (cytochrome) n=1 Tax=Rhizoclosmatium globosum TaxID=329046 RepID=A0A1Y2BTW9_9FUNG|nr:FMN-dependent alpha-hydroxy acid dehydrogenase [Rhizoclosmatium globosum]|eukprot:ORY38183.1 FMN-dependent alpha-hydroxy acid dehydrogenase [Rhizoclosmatium globosum]
MYHPKDLLETVLPPALCIGTLDPTSTPVQRSLVPAESKKHSSNEKPSINEMLNAFDFEAVARKVLKPESWAYYSSGAEDELTLRENHAAFHRILFKPRVLINVSNISTTTTFLSSPSSLPVYITACALGKLGHPEGEVVLTRAAGAKGVIQMMPTLASCSLDEMLDARVVGQDTWFQLYVNGDREVTRKVVKRAEERGCKGLFVTVDAPSLGRREKDMRLKYSSSVSDIQEKNNGSNVNRNMGAARAISSFIDATLSWPDIEWLGSITTMPIVLKGIQTGQDAVRAAYLPCVKGIVVSNHGGRQLDTCRSGIQILPEVVAALKSVGLRDRLEIFLDGGVRRGADIFKALALGAKGVGIGRPSLYA